MLNELLIAERGARQVGMKMTQRHPDIKDARRVPTLLVCLDKLGQVESVRPIPAEVTPWSLRDGNHNSFPFVQPKIPLWIVDGSDDLRQKIVDRKSKVRRESVLALAGNTTFNAAGLSLWPGDGLLIRLHERRKQLAILDGTDATAITATIDRFMLACDSMRGGGPHLLSEIICHLTKNLEQVSENDWIDVAAALLVEGTGAFIFDAAGAWPSIMESSVVNRISETLRIPTNRTEPKTNQRCGLTGEIGELVESKFPQPNLPLLGQTYLFSRNRDTPANGRYGRFSADAMPVTQEVVIRLAATFDALTSAERRGVTWRAIPGEAPKQSDLLLAFVDGALDVPTAALLADEGEEDLSQEGPTTASQEDSGSITKFEERAERLIDTVRAAANADLSRFVRLAVFRKLDPANRKVVYSGQITVEQLHRAALEWIAGERNLPEIELPVLRKGERTPRKMQPPHMAPLALIAFSRRFYRRGGLERQEVVGLPASEVLALFLESPVRKRTNRILHLTLARRMILLTGTCHALRKGFEFAKEFDRLEVLRTLSILGMLLLKLNRKKETYMNETAFKLGQLLAAADVLHAGYCASVRSGDVPPSLLGNQVFAMALTSPFKALMVLGRRWKPYVGWAEKAVRDVDPKTKLRRDEEMRDSKDRIRQQRGWDISRAISAARRMKPLAAELSSLITDDRTDDIFRAEFLLGYIAGLPKMQIADGADDGQDIQIT